MITCLVCNKKFKNLSYHVTTHGLNIQLYKSKFGNNCEIVDKELIEKFREINTGQNNPRYGIGHSKETKYIIKKKRYEYSLKIWQFKIDVFRKCDNCNAWFPTKYCYGKNKFLRKTCSIKCAAIIGNKAARLKIDGSEKIRNKIVESARAKSIQLWQDENYIKKMDLANNKRRFTSKGEIEVRTHFINNFPDDGWTFGGTVVKDGIRMSRDLYSNKLKICIEYDGVWHFKDIHNQLKNKQLKDKKLKEWCEINNFRLIRVKEEVYLNNKAECLNVLEKRCYGSREKYIELY